jgi:hypothetical protein
MMRPRLELLEAEVKNYHAPKAPWSAGATAPAFLCQAAKRRKLALPQSKAGFARNPPAAKYSRLHPRLA